MKRTKRLTGIQSSQSIGTVTNETPNVVLEIFNEKNDSIDYAEGDIVEVYRSIDSQSYDRYDNYALYSGGLKDGRTFNVRVYLDDCPMIMKTPRDPNDKRVYPKRDDFEARLKSYISPENDSPALRSIADFIVEAVGEYEHGTADVEDVERVNLDQYIAVIEDLFRGLKDRTFDCL